VKHISGKSRRRMEVRQRMKKRMMKDGYMVVDEFRHIDPETFARLKAVTDYLNRPFIQGSDK